MMHSTSRSFIAMLALLVMTACGMLVGLAIIDASSQMWAFFREHRLPGT